MSAWSLTHLADDTAGNTAVCDCIVRDEAAFDRASDDATDGSKDGSEDHDPSEDASGDAGDSGTDSTLSDSCSDSDSREDDSDGADSWDEGDDDEVMDPEEEAELLRKCQANIQRKSLARARQLREHIVRLNSLRDEYHTLSVQLEQEKNDQLALLQTPLKSQLFPCMIGVVGETVFAEKRSDVVVDPKVEELLAEKNIVERNYEKLFEEASRMKHDLKEQNNKRLLTPEKAHHAPHVRWALRSLPGVKRYSEAVVTRQNHPEPNYHDDGDLTVSVKHKVLAKSKTELLPLIAKIATTPSHPDLTITSSTCGTSPGLVVQTTLTPPSASSPSPTPARRPTSRQFRKRQRPMLSVNLGSFGVVLFIFVVVVGAAIVIQSLD